MISKLKELKNNQGFMKYFKNTSWLFVEKIVRMGVGLFVGIWVARYLGPQNFGLFSYAQSFVGLFSSLATLGLSGIVVRELVKYPQQEDQLLTTAFVLKIFGAVAMFILLAMAVNVTSNDYLTKLLIFIVASGVIFQSFNIIDSYFQAKVMSKYIVFTNSLTLLLSSVIKIILIMQEGSLVAFAWVVVFDNIVMSSGYIYWFFKVRNTHNAQKFSFRFSFSLAKRLLGDSWPLILSGMVVAVYMKIDQVMLQEMLGSEAVGNYAAAVRLSEAWYFIPMVLASSLFPAIVHAKEISEQLYHERLQKLYDLMVFMALVIALPMTFLSDDIIDLLYGAQYNEAGGVLMIHIWAAVFVFLGVAGGKWFVAENLQKYSLYRTLSGACLNIMLNFMLIPHYGIYGAAVATLFSQAMASYAFNMLSAPLRVNFMMQTKALFLTRLWKGLLG